MNQDHKEHSRKIAFQCAEALHKHWPNLHLEGFDIEKATDIMKTIIPICQAEAYADMEAIDKTVLPVRDYAKGIGTRLRKSLDMENGTLFEAVKLATEVLERLPMSDIRSAKASA
ncbi:MAG: hypothetical protein ACXAC5_03405 [Promethearchaeota archaeon]|jgi:hypothetical protein